MDFRLYNTLTKRVETFVPLDPAGRLVRFYSCGPTVYDYAHIGNFRSFLNADVLRRALESFGYEVLQVMNMTDVGHMTDDELADGGGEDKMVVAAERLRQAKKAGTLPAGIVVDPGDPYAIADFYIAAFLRDARALGLEIIADADREPSLMPRPTRYIEPMIALVEQLLERDHAYVGSDGVVYFDVQSFPAYGRLSGNTLDRIRSGEGGRVDRATQLLKRHPADFLLWKRDPSHVMKWPSPWGEGYPGWHLECSVMAMALLGRETNGVIDIHSGGEDNIFPHHECEIAQTCAASGEQHFARYWFHTRYLLVEGEKMSKSKGNFFTFRDLHERGWSPAAIRLELIRTHYRKNANFTLQGLADSSRQVSRWVELRSWLEEHRDVPIDAPGPLVRALEPFMAALASDLNVAGAIGELSQAAREWDTSAPPQPSGRSGGVLAGELDALDRMGSVLGVLEIETDAPIPQSADPGASETRIESLLEERAGARRARDWGEADRLRDELLALGVAIKDGPEGTTWTRVRS